MTKFCVFVGAVFITARVSFEPFGHLLNLRDRAENGKLHLKHFRTSIRGANRLPDRLKIISTYEWYILDAVAETLIRYDGRAGIYTPALAESWKFDHRGIVLTLRDGQKFNDGRPLRSEDVLASMQEVVRKRTSTHYQIWKYLPNCNLKDCSAIRVENGNELIINYTGDMDSLFMFLASPEGSVWSAEDIRSGVTPRQFSGFYFPEEIDSSSMKLRKNPNNVRAAEFPFAPESVDVRGDLTLDQSLDALRAGVLDGLLVPQTPFRDFQFALKDFTVHRTEPVALTYLTRTGKAEIQPFNDRFLDQVWSASRADEFAAPSYGILPPGVEGGLTREEALHSIGGNTSAAAVRIGAFIPFHSRKFTDLIVQWGAVSGIKIDILAIDREEFFEAVSHPEKARFDYLLSSYLASDEFPLIQLKLILDGHKVPFDFSKVSVDSAEKLKYLKEIQKFSLSRQQVVPLLYMSQMIIAGKEVDLGDQPTSDVDLQLWRINENSKRTRR